MNRCDLVILDSLYERDQHGYDIKSFVVDSYLDNAVGVMEKVEGGNIEMTQITLRPHVKFSGEKQPTMEQLEKMHHQSHEQCFLANSVKTEILTEIIV